MPEKKATYRINESMLRNTLLGYTVEVDAAECNAIEQEASTVRMQKTFVLPSAKVLIQFVAIPLVLITSCILVYSNLDSIQAAFTPIAEPAKVEVKQKAVVTPQPVATTPSVAVNNTPPPVVNNVAVKQDSIVAVNKTTDSAKHQNVSKQAVPVVAGPPIDSSTSSKPVSVTKATKVDTASHRSSDPPVKKKKKKRRRSNNIDDLKESTLQPNSADDDVVVPQ